MERYIAIELLFLVLVVRFLSLLFVGRIVALSRVIVFIYIYFRTKIPLCFMMYSPPGDAFLRISFFFMTRRGVLRWGDT